MRLNDLRSSKGARKTAKRVGRGPGSDMGKTCGRGVKGQKSRSGGYHKVGFEGGQMPLQRRLPKRGFNSASRELRDEVRLDALARFGDEAVTLESLKKAGLIRNKASLVKIIKAGEISVAVKVDGVPATAGARAAIEAAGGSVN
ncbi:50S ribosomal protein L15 [Oceanococcus atlanticus]|uniref:Large ribosomal subunit protein uL15 n=1 Tax=Oceanococcus atlanticus TaxID=1317117 RepID=A0A1Y1SH11_9GAMM|nr:50S ribosomal protein L15 [Oceanococcus atlanticus]ORE88962.1 50S ribosomal protein L15 [Oceanococcus atlanticus]RZO83160.1 MAG: 50S ribosomal protein L15 [Oceanococcus sp.]